MSTGDSIGYSFDGRSSSSSTASITSIAVDIDSVSEGITSSSSKAFVAICTRRGVVIRETFVGLDVRCASAR